MWKLGSFRRGFERLSLRGGHSLLRRGSIDFGYQRHDWALV